MLDKIGNFIDGVTSGITQGVSELAEENKKTALKKFNATEEVVAMKKRITALEKKMATAMELIAILQKQVMNTDFDEEPEKEEEEPV